MPKQKNHKFKSFAAIIIAVVLLITSSASGVSVSPYWTGSGTSTDPYIISNLAGLSALASQVNSGNAFKNTYFALGANIDLGSITNWTSIGNGSTRPFSGIFDGRHYFISNLKFNYPAMNGTVYYGLFGYTSGAVIKNIIIQNAYYNCQVNSSLIAMYYGSIVGYGVNTVIYNCGIAYGTIVTDKEDNHSVATVGGMVGYLSPGSYVINCYNNSSLTYHNGVRDNYYYGGIAGTNEGTIYNCFNTSKIASYNGSMYKAEQDPISGNHKQDYPNYYDSTVYGTLDRQDTSIPLTTQQMQSDYFKNILNQNKENIPADYPVKSADLDVWGVNTNQYPLPTQPTTTVPYFISYSSLTGVSVSGDTKSVTLNDITSDMVPVTLDKVEVSSALSGLLYSTVPSSGSGKLAIAMRYNGNSTFITNGMTVGQTIISTASTSPAIEFIYYADSNMKTLLSNEPINVTLKSTSNNIITYYSFNIKITTQQSTAAGQALYDRGRNYDGITASTTNPFEPSSSFTIQFLTNYNPSLYGAANTRRIILQSSTQFPAKTKFTLIDKTDLLNPKYYYYVNNSLSSSIELSNFYIMGTAYGVKFTLPNYNELKIENFTIVVDYSNTNGSALSSDIYLRHTINNSETDILTSVPKVHSVIGIDNPSVMLSSTTQSIENIENVLLNLSITASHTNTIYDEQKYSVELSSINPFPYGTKVKLGNTYYDVSGSNQKVILPIQAEGTYSVTLEPPTSGFTDNFTVTADLYSAPDSLYPYTTLVPISSSTANIIVHKNSLAIKVSLADAQRLIAAGSATPLNFTVNTAISAGVNRFRVTMHKKIADKGFDYTKVSTPIIVPITSGSTLWTYTPPVPWEKGIYRFVFELIDGSDNPIKTTSINVIVYDK